MPPQEGDIVGVHYTASPGSPGSCLISYEQSGKESTLHNSQAIVPQTELSDIRALNKDASDFYLGYEVGYSNDTSKKRLPSMVSVVNDYSKCIAVVLM